jgi:hypothetical protein
MPKENVFPRIKDIRSAQRYAELFKKYNEASRKNGNTCEILAGMTTILVTTGLAESFLLTIAESWPTSAKLIC